MQSNFVPTFSEEWITCLRRFRHVNVLRAVHTCMHVPVEASHIHTVPSWLPVNNTFPKVCHLQTTNNFGG